MATCNFNHAGSVSLFEDHLACTAPAVLALVVQLGHDQPQLVELVCKDADHFALANDTLCGMGDVTVYALADVTGRVA